MVFNADCMKILFFFRTTSTVVLKCWNCLWKMFRNPKRGLFCCCHLPSLSARQRVRHFLYPYSLLFKIPTPSPYPAPPKNALPAIVVRESVCVIINGWVFYSTLLKVEVCMCRWYWKSNVAIRSNTNKVTFILFCLGQAVLQSFYLFISSSPFSFIVPFSINFISKEITVEPSWATTSLIPCLHETHLREVTCISQ